MTPILNTSFSDNGLRCLFSLLLTAIFILSTPIALADSSSPRLAAYYENFLAICGSRVYQWNGLDTPQVSLSGVRQVGVGKRNRYALTEQNELLAWEDDPNNTSVLMGDVKSFYAGRSGLFVIRKDDSLWTIPTNSVLGFGEDISSETSLVAKSVLTAAVGDSANYYVTPDGALFVRGLAHRGQYGDGKLTSTDTYKKTLENAVQVASHTGHTLVLKQDGSVWGTGGNIYGPLGKHGFGDKATQWGLIMEGAIAIATGSSHSLAIGPDGHLWIWGRNEGLEPKVIMSDVVAVAAGNRSTIAIANNLLWQWNTGDKPRQLMQCR